MNPSSSLQDPANPSLSNVQPKPGRIRALGWVLIVLGPGISAAMACAAYTLNGAAAVDRLTGRSPRWHGSPELIRMASELFVTVFLLGVVIMLGGIYQVRTDRRSPVVIVATLGLAAVTAYLVFGIASSR